MLRHYHQFKQNCLEKEQNRTYYFRLDLLLKSLVVYFKDSILKHFFLPKDPFSILSLKQSVPWATWKIVLKNSWKTSFHYNSWKKCDSHYPWWDFLYLQRVNLNIMLISPSPSKQHWIIRIRHFAYYGSNVIISCCYNEDSVKKYTSVENITW